MEKLKLDIRACTGCGECVLTCAFKNAGSYDLLQSNIRVIKWEDIELFVAIACQQCKEAACMAACPNQAISHHPLTGVIVYDRGACDMCYNCIDECTYQVMHVSPAGEPVTCDLCGGSPECVQACSPHALSFVDVPEEQWEPFYDLSEVLVARAGGKNVPAPEGFLTRPL